MLSHPQPSEHGWLASVAPPAPTSPSHQITGEGSSPSVDEIHIFRVLHIREGGFDGAGRDTPVLVDNTGRHYPPLLQIGEGRRQGLGSWSGGQNGDVGGVE